MAMLDFFNALSSGSTDLLKDGVGFIEATFNAISTLFESSSKSDVAPEPDSIPWTPLEPATPIDPVEADPEA